MNVSANRNEQSKNERRIRSLSKGLKYCCLTGIVLYPILTVIYWTFDIFQLRQFRHTHWYFQFSDTPYIPLEKLSFQMKLIGVSLDLIPCAFFLAIFFLLARLFRQYERLQFFSKGNIKRIQWIAFVLFFQQLIYPFYLALRTYIFTPSGEKYIIFLSGPNALNGIIIVFTILLIAYIMESALELEKELAETI